MFVLKASCPLVPMRNSIRLLFTIQSQTVILLGTNLKGKNVVYGIYSHLFSRSNKNKKAFKVLRLKLEIFQVCFRIRIGEIIFLLLF